jgi:hypothetical protein
MPTGEDLNRIGSAPVPASARDRIVRASMQRLAAPRRSIALWYFVPAAVSLAIGIAIGFFVIWPDKSPSREVAHEIVAPKPPPPAAKPVEPSLAGTTLLAVDAPRDYGVGPHVARVFAKAKVRVERDDGKHFEIRIVEGASGFAVRHLGAEESFQVRVGPALVEVVGTKFEVETVGACGMVSVSEGRVRVTVGNAIEFVGKGERRVYCPDASPDSKEPGAELVREALVALSSNELARAETLLKRSLADSPDGPFAEEALFHLCMLELRLQRPDEARSLFLDFKRRFPKSEQVQTLEKLLAKPE